MKLLILITISISLVGCATTPTTSIPMINFSWTPNDPSVTSYRVYEEVGSMGPVKVLEVKAPASQGTMPDDLGPGTYTFFMTSFNSVDNFESEPTDSVTYVKGN